MAVGQSPIVLSYRQPEVKAKAAILVDVGTGQVLFEKNADQKLPPASLTKLMTALILMENCQPDEIVRASERATKTPSSSMHLMRDEEISVHGMLQALLLRSANDGCVAVAEHVSGSLEKFIERMNAKAKELGATSTTFRNPHGLHDKEHLSTARDLAKIALEAIKIPLINETAKLPTCCIVRSMNQEDTVFISHNKLLGKYQWADGLKTGYTRQAGPCLAASATRDGRRQIAIILNSPDRDTDAIALLEYGFNQWTAVPRPPDTIKAMLGNREIKAVASQVPEALVPAVAAASSRWVVEVEPERVSAQEGDVIGKVKLLGEGEPLVMADLVSMESIGPPASWSRVLGALLLGAVAIAFSSRKDRHRRRPHGR